ncbi:NmrA family NAD(P)-binding protein [Actinopolymorpha pittospori]
MNTGLEKSILVTGATGKTGSSAVRSLLADGLRVRALVHREDERSDQLAAAGAEVVSGDLLSLDDVGAAMRDVGSAYFVYPIRPGLIEATVVFAQAATENGVDAIVNMSQISARREAKSDAARQHWLAERVLDRYPAQVTHLRPTFFAEWLIVYGEYDENGGVLRFPMGDGRHAPIAGEDLGRLAAAIVANPGPHAGKTYPIFGPVELHHNEIAARVSKALGRPVRYEPIGPSTFADILRGRGWDPHRIQHLRNVAIDYQNGIFAGTNDVIETITGARPMGVEEFVEKNRQEFNRASR